MQIGRTIRATGESWWARWRAIDARSAALLSLAPLAVLGAFVVAVPHPLEQPLGVDFDLYRDATARWLAGGSFFEPYQLAGPYEIRAGDILYPPVALWLFAPFAAAGGGPLGAVAAILWWAIPLAITGAVVLRLRPAPWAWPLLALCAANPTTLLKTWTGNPVIWSMAALAIAVIGGRTRFAAPFVLLKPSLAPFALFGANRRSWWLGLAAVVALCVPFGWSLGGLGRLGPELARRGAALLRARDPDPRAAARGVAGADPGRVGARGARRSVGEEVAVLGVALQEPGDELALGHEMQAAPPDVVEGRPGEAASDAHPLGPGQDLGVDEHDRPGLVGQLVLGDPDHSVAEPGLVARFLGVVLDEEVGGDGRGLGHRGMVGPSGDLRVALRARHPPLAASVTDRLR